MNDDNTYKFMTNIIQHSRHRTRYIKQLKNVTIDAQVSYVRLFTSLAIALAIVLGVVFMLRSHSDRLGYVALPIILMGLALLVILVIYLISSRNKSLLASVVDFIIFQLGEGTRRAATKRKTLSSLGIDNVDNGVIRFSNGDVGLMYDVEGQISRSVLPAVATATAEVRRRYYVSRSPSTQEMLITSVRKADLRTNMNHLVEINEHSTEAIENGDKSRIWDEYMSKMLYEYVEENMAANDIQTFQSLILRDKSLAGLKKARNHFEDACREGMYAKVDPITDQAEIARRLRGMSTMSADGLSRITGENEHDRAATRYSFDARTVIENQDIEEGHDDPLANVTAEDESTEEEHIDDLTHQGKQVVHNG